MNSEGSKVIIGYCSICNSKKTMTVSNNSIQAEKLGSFFQKTGKIFC